MAGPRPGVYVCWRCGRHVQYDQNRHAEKPDLCRDCKDVLAYESACGTYRGYQQHKRADEEPCAECYEALRVESARRREQKRDQKRRAKQAQAS